MKALLISCFDWYEKRLEPIKEVLEEQHYHVTVLTSDFDHMKKRYIDDKRADCTYIHVPKYQKNLSPQRILSHLKFGAGVRKYLNEMKPDLIYLLLPPNHTAKYCLQYKKKYPDTTYILDIIDLWPESMPIGKWKNTFPCRIWAGYRNKSIEKADYIFTECDMYQKKLKRYMDTPGNIETLHLFKNQTKKERSLVEKIIEDSKNPMQGKNITLGYVGSINHIIDIDGITSVVTELFHAGYKVRLRVIGNGESKELLLDSLEKTGADVTYYGSIYEEEKKIEILTPCDFGINMMKDDVVVGLSIKSIDYFSYGLPIINNIKGDTWNLVQNNKMGINVADNWNTFVSELSFFQKNVQRKNILTYFDCYFTKKVFKKKIDNALKGGLKKRYV